MQDTSETIARLRSLVDELRRSPSAILLQQSREKLDALLALAQAEEFLEDRTRHIDRQKQRETLPPGYSLTRSYGRYGYRPSPQSPTVEWSSSPYSARRAAWVHHELSEGVVDEAEIQETLELRFSPAEAATHRAIVDIALKGAELGMDHGRFDLDDLTTDIVLAGGEAAKEAVVDHLVLLGFLEEIPPNPEGSGMRAFRWIRSLPTEALDF
jgi:hypothetical protein